MNTRVYSRTATKTSARKWNAPVMPRILATLLSCALAGSGGGGSAIGVSEDMAEVRIA